MSVSQQLAEFIVSTRYEQVPEASLAMVQASLLDYSACAIAGQHEPVSEAIKAMMNAEAGVGMASVIGQEQKLPARAAALINGACAHALDYDDTHFDYIGHTSVAVFPAAIAMAEQVSATGKEFLLAAQIGLEVACRVGAFMGRSHYEAGYHQTATSGSFGAAAAAAKLLGLNTRQCQQMFGLLSSRASGLKNQFGSMGKPYNAGMAASNGVEVALLVSHGMDSIENGLEAAFAASHHGEADEHALASLGSDYRFDYISHKFHACCHGTHAALEALIDLRQDYNLLPDQIKHIQVKVHPRWLKVCDLPEPTSGLQAKFSYRMVLAMVMQGLNTGDPLAYKDDLHEQEGLQASMSQLVVMASDQLSDTQAEVRVELLDGRSLNKAYDCGATLPMDLLMIKLTAKAQVLVGAKAAASIGEQVANLGTNPGNAEVFKLALNG
jgi:2-methylcitrate dehydratase PrpD